MDDNLSIRGYSAHVKGSRLLFPLYDDVVFYIKWKEFTWSSIEEYDTIEGFSMQCSDFKVVYASDMQPKVLAFLSKRSSETGRLEIVFDNPIDEPMFCLFDKDGIFSDEIEIPAGSIGMDLYEENQFLQVEIYDEEYTDEIEYDYDYEEDEEHLIAQEDLTSDTNCQDDTDELSDIVNAVSDDEIIEAIQKENEFLRSENNRLKEEIDVLRLKKGNSDILEDEVARLRKVITELVDRELNSPISETLTEFVNKMIEEVNKNREALKAKRHSLSELEEELSETKQNVEFEKQKNSELIQLIQETQKIADEMGKDNSKKIEELRILLDEIGMDGDYVISGCLVREKESSDKK